jgi:hypothetical protein
MNVRGQLLRFAKNVRHVRRCVELEKLSEEEASEMVEKLASLYAEQIAGAGDQPGDDGDTIQSPDAGTDQPTKSVADSVQVEEDDDGSEALSLLTGMGIETLIAQQLASQCSPEDIEGWCKYARHSKGLTNPAGLVVSRLRSGVPAPRSGSNGNDPERYVTGIYAEYIQY